MKTPLAWLNLVHNRVRTAVAVAGVAFAIILMFMQLGFLEAVKASAAIIYDVLEFDICIRSTDYLHLADARTFPRSRLHQAQGIEGVEAVPPFHLALATWRSPKTGDKRGVLMMGLQTHDDVFVPGPIRDTARRSLNAPDDVLIDTTTRVEFGPRNGKNFSDLDLGVVAEIDNHQVRIAGHYTRGAGFSASGAVLMNERGFFQVAPGAVADQVSLGLVRLKPGADAEQVVARLRRELPGDVEVLSRQETITRELNRWVYDTNYGLIFRTGVVVAVIVGTAIVYQVLVSEVASLLPEYATLKAMGYKNRFLAGVVLQQAVVLAVIGFIPGVGFSKLMYTITTTGAGIPIRFTGSNFLLVLVLSLSMCVISGLLAVRKIFKADPADLF